MGRNRDRTLRLADVDRHVPSRGLIQKILFSSGYRNLVVPGRHCESNDRLSQSSMPSVDVQSGHTSFSAAIVSWSLPWFALPISHIGSRNSFSIIPIKYKAVFTGIGFDSIKRSLKS